MVKMGKSAALPGQRVRFRMADGAVVERYAYDSYGKATVLSGPVNSSGNPTWDWSARAANASAYGNEITYGAYRADPETGLNYDHARYYKPTFGVWTQRDPAGYIDGLSLYQYVQSNPTTYTDPTGLCEVKPTITQVSIVTAGGKNDVVWRKCDAFLGMLDEAFGIHGFAKYGIAHSYLFLERGVEKELIEMGPTTDPIDKTGKMLGSGAIFPFNYIEALTDASKAARRLSGVEDTGALPVPKVEDVIKEGLKKLDELAASMKLPSIGGLTEGYGLFSVPVKDDPRKGTLLDLDLAGKGPCAEVDAIEKAAKAIGEKTSTEGNMTIRGTSYHVGFAYDFPRTCNSFTGSVLRAAGVPIPTGGKKLVGIDQVFTDWTEMDKAAQGMVKSSVDVIAEAYAAIAAAQKAARSVPVPPIPPLFPPRRIQPGDLIVPLPSPPMPWERGNGMWPRGLRME